MIKSLSCKYKYRKGKKKNRIKKGKYFENTASFSFPLHSEFISFFFTFLLFYHKVFFFTSMFFSYCPFSFYSCQTYVLSHNKFSYRTGANNRKTASFIFVRIDLERYLGYEILSDTATSFLNCFSNSLTTSFS